MHNHDEHHLFADDSVAVVLDSEAPWLEDEESSWTPEQITHLLGRQPRMDLKQTARLFHRREYMK